MSKKSMIAKCSSCGAKNRLDPPASGNKKIPVCGNCSKPIRIDTAPLTITDSNFSAEVIASDLPVLLDLWAEWCAPCRMVAPVIEKLAEELAGRVRFGKLDVDKNPATAARYGVQSIPMLIIIRDGKEAGRLIGAQSREAILAKLQPYI